MATSAANLSTSCLESIGACRVRATRLKSSGAFAAQPNNVYVSDSLVDVTPSRQTTKGDNFQAKDGCGNVRATFQGCDFTNSIDVTINFIEWEPALWEMCTGGTVYMSGGKVVGFEDPLSDAGCVPGVALEIWSRAWDTDQQAVDLTTGNPVWVRVGYGKVVFVLGDYKLANDISQVPLVGHATANSQFGLGPSQDWPASLQAITGWFYDKTIPAASCGYLSYDES